MVAVLFVYIMSNTAYKRYNQKSCHKYTNTVTVRQTDQRRQEGKTAWEMNTGCGCKRQREKKRKRHFSTFLFNLEHTGLLSVISAANITESFTFHSCNLVPTEVPQWSCIMPRARETDVEWQKLLEATNLTDVCLRLLNILNYWCSLDACQISWGGL